MKSLKIFINSINFINSIKYGILKLYNLQNDNDNINYGINLRMKINNVRVINNPISKFENVTRDTQLTPGIVNYIKMFKQNLFINKITKKDLLSLMRITAYQNNSYKKSDINKYLRSENYKNLVTLQKHIYLHPAIYSILGIEGNYTIIGMSLLSTKRKALYDPVTGIKVPYIEVPNSIQFICGSTIYFKVKNANLDIVLKYLNDNPNVLRGGLESVDIIKDVYIEHLEQLGVIFLRFGDRIDVDMHK